MKEKELRRNLAVFPIGSVMKLTDLTARQIRRYELSEHLQGQRHLSFCHTPDWTMHNAMNNNQTNDPLTFAITSAVVFICIFNDKKKAIRIKKLQIFV